MMSRTFAWLLILALLSVSFLSIIRVSAQEDEDDHDIDISEEPESKSTSGSTTTSSTLDDDVEDDSDEPERQMYILPATDVKTSVIFPDAPDKRFVQGEEVTVLLGFHNTGTKEYNITYIGGHFHSLLDFGYFIQNFSVREVGARVGAGEQVSVEYRFKPDISLEPTEFIFSSWIFYNNTANQQVFRNFYVNSTVELLEKRSQLDAKTLFQYLLFAAVVGLIGYTFVQVSASGKKLQRAVGRSTKSKNTAPAEWDTQIYKPATKAKAIAGSRGSRKAKKDIE